jgi:hypothetical protein
MHRWLAEREARERARRGLLMRWLLFSRVQQESENSLHCDQRESAANMALGQRACHALILEPSFAPFMPLMKLKLKFIDSSSITHRVEVPGNASLSELQQLVVASLSRTTPLETLSFSLNKKDHLSGDLTLSQQGVRPGDILWVSAPSQAESHAHPSSDLPQALPLPSSMDIDPPATSSKHSDASMVPTLNLTASNHLSRLISEAKANGAPPSAHSLMLMAIHSTMLEAGFELIEGYHERDLAAITPTKTWRRTYRYSRAADEDSAPRECRLVAFPLGSNILVLHASTISLPSSSALPLSPLPQSVKTLHLTLSDDISPNLIRTLKDELSLHLLTRCFQEAGLVPPLGWPVLPREIQLKILALLDSPQDLSSAARSCTDMWKLVYCSDHDDQMSLWSNAFVKEFGGLMPGEGELASAGGLRGAFISRWMRRKQIEEERKRRAREASEHLRRRWPLFNPGVPFPGRGGFGPPGLGPNNRVVGGDYDRFPLFGGLPGGIPGGGLGPGGGRGGGGFHQHGFFQ